MCFTNSQTKYTTLNELRLVTWNVRGVMSSAATLSKLLDQHNVDIAFVTMYKLRIQNRNARRVWIEAGKPRGMQYVIRKL